MIDELPAPRKLFGPDGPRYCDGITTAGYLRRGHCFSSLDRHADPSPGSVCDLARTVASEYADVDVERAGAVSGRVGCLSRCFVEAVALRPGAGSAVDRGVIGVQLALPRAVLDRGVAG